MIFFELLLHLNVNGVRLFHEFDHWCFVPSREEHLFVVVVPPEIVLECRLRRLLFLFLFPADVGTPKGKSISDEDVEQQNVH